MQCLVALTSVSDGHYRPADQSTETMPQNIMRLESLKEFVNIKMILFCGLYNTLEKVGVNNTRR